MRYAAALRNARELPLGRLCGCLLGAAACWVGTSAHAQAPAQPGTARLIVPFGPGGSTDTMARLLAEELRRIGRANLVIENFPGAAGRLAVENCAKARPDGHAFCLGTQSTHTIPLLSSLAGAADNLKRLAPVALIGTQPVVIAVHPGVPARDMRELATWLRDVRGAAFSTAGIGTLSHLAGLSIARELGIELTHVPYKSGQESSLAAVSGQVAITISQLGAIQPYLGNRKLIAIAVTGNGRMPALPEVPTLRESLDPRLVFVTYVGVFAPQDISEAAASGMYEDLRAATLQEGLRQRLWNLGMDVDVRRAAEFADLLAREKTLWQEMLKAHAIEPN